MYVLSNPFSFFHLLRKYSIICPPRSALGVPLGMDEEFSSLIHIWNRKYKKPVQYIHRLFMAQKERLEIQKVGLMKFNEMR